MTDEKSEAECSVCKCSFEVYGEREDYKCHSCGRLACNSCTYTFKDKAYCETCFEIVNPIEKEKQESKP